MYSVLLMISPIVLNSRSPNSLIEMVFVLPSLRPTQSLDSPSNSSDLFTTARTLKNELALLEERYKHNKSKSTKLEEEHTQLVDLLKFFQTVEKNEKNNTCALQHELSQLRANELLGFNIDDMSATSILEYESSFVDHATPDDRQDDELLSLLHDRRVAHNMAALLNMSTLATPPDTPDVDQQQGSWRSKLTSLVPYALRNSPSFLGSYSRLADEDVKSESAPVQGSQDRLLQEVTSTAVNETIQRRRSSKRVLGAGKPKHFGGTELQTILPRKAHHKSRKPFAPMIFPKSRPSCKRRVSTSEISKPVEFWKLPKPDTFGRASIDRKEEQAPLEVM
ncbi:hypothetical protein C8Q75DRAFT_767515 [Abortiporus biennis]|nr:hypothetical protein C8Q75DRAFT_767515 [Abortiporus biennis]